MQHDHRHKVSQCAESLTDLILGNDRLTCCIQSKGVIQMGRDEHNKRKNNYLAQTPKNQKTDGIDVEFSDELADADDREAQARSRAADKRAHKK